MKNSKAPEASNNQGNLTNMNINLRIDKPFHSKNEHFLLNFEYHFDTIRCKVCIIIESIKNHFSVILTLNSVNFTLCYASVNTFYITKNNSGIRKVE